jgi:type II secretion system protein G
MTGHHHINIFQPKQRGFTIVELLIVIVVIAILAAIVIVAYQGIQGRARDSARLSDMKMIMKALEVYKTNTGSYPSPNSTPNAQGWEVSTNGASATNFLGSIINSNGVTKIPVDPVNTGNSANLNPSWNTNEYEYFYYLYPAGNNGCDVSRGAFYVLGVTRMDTVPSGTASPSSPGWACGTGYWSGGFGAWVTGSYTN